MDRKQRRKDDEAMEKLKRSHFFLTAVVENTTDAIYLKDTLGRYLMVNPAVTRFVGKPHEEIIGKDDTALFDPDSAAWIMSTDRKVMLSGKPQTYEEKVTSAGFTRTYFSTKGPIRDDEGNVVGLFGIARDITERKRTEDALRLSEERYHSLFENMREGFAYCRMLIENNEFRDFVYLDVNAAFESLTGLKNVVGRNVTEVIPGIREANPELFEIYGRVALTGKAERFETYVDALGIWLSISVYSPGKEFFVAVFDNITERKRVEEALRASEEKYRMVVENAGEAIIIAQDGLILFANPRVSEILGVPAEKIVGRPISCLIHPEDLDMVTAYHTKRMQGDQAPAYYEFRALTSAGEIVWLENSVVLTKWEGGRAALSFLRDITQQKRLETQLVQSQKMEAVGRLAGGIAHDFNNLLTVITGYVSLILCRLGNENPFHKEMVEIQKAAEKTADLTRQLLAFSRKQVLQPKIVSLNHIVSGMEILLRRLIGEDIELSIVLEKNVPTVMVDPGQIGQIVINLAVNARDAMPKGGKLTIETKIIDLDDSFAQENPSLLHGPHVVLSVSDTGVGMDRETMSKIFEPFFTTKEKGKGTGLGLSTAYGIVNQSRGHISAESIPGKGTTFRIYLPKTDGIETSSEEVRSEEAGGGEETVLVVEDEPVVRTLVTEILAAKGYPVLSAGSGEEATLLSRDFKGPIHLLVTDVVMTGMNGRDLADRISAERPGIKVLFMSGYTDDAIGHHGVLEDGIEFLSKPFSPATLVNKVRKILDAR